VVREISKPLFLVVVWHMASNRLFLPIHELFFSITIAISSKELDMRRFNNPPEIQRFLDKLKYRIEGGARSPRIVEQTKTANCFDGAVYAAAALETLGYNPLIVDLEAKDDDDHVIAVYHSHGWGAIAKSNTTILRSREPVYRTIRELVMTYFDVYFNTAGYKGLRRYCAPVNLKRFDAISWRTTDKPLDPIEDHLYKVRHYPMISRQMEQELSWTGKDIMRACFLDSNPKGLFKPKRYTKNPGS